MVNGLGFKWLGIRCASIGGINYKKRNTMTAKRLTITTDSLPADLSDLIAQVGSLPEEYRNQLNPSLNRVVEYTRPRRRILNLIQEALSQLRLDMKYLMFDLESTRVERDKYKEALDGEF